jgi:hypothetical protein
MMIIGFLIQLWLAYVRAHIIKYTHERPIKGDPYGRIITAYLLERVPCPIYQR